MKELLLEGTGAELRRELHEASGDRLDCFSGWGTSLVCGADLLEVLGTGLRLVSGGGGSGSSSSSLPLLKRMIGDRDRLATSKGSMDIVHLLST